MTLLDDRMRDPTHHGPITDATGSGAVGNPACGDVVTIYLRVVAGRVDQAGFESVGSAYQLATASVLCDCIEGEQLDRVRGRGPDCVLERLPDLPANKRHLAHLAVDALRRAVADHEARATGGAGSDDVRRLDDDAAESFVLRLLANGRPWGTKEILAMAKADGLALPAPLARFLSTLRRRGVIAGEMDVQHRSWRWSLPEPTEAGDGAG